MRENNSDRQLWVDDHLVSRTSIEIPRSVVEFTPQGVVINDPIFDYLAKLQDQNRNQMPASVTSNVFTDIAGGAILADGAACTWMVYLRRQRG